MTQDPREELARYDGPLRVWAGDAEQHPSRCRVFSAAKVRQRFTAEGWQLRYSEQPFMLGVIRDIIVALHRDDRTATWEGLQEALAEQMAHHPSLHPGVKAYIPHAVENYLDAHDEIAALHSEMQYITMDPVTGDSRRQLKVWAPLYRAADGTREIRRLRTSAARSSKGPQDDRWTMVAAYIASKLQMKTAPAIRVVEVGLHDGSTEIVFQGTPDEVRARYDEYVRPVIQGLLQPGDYRPGQSCQKCKLAGCCPSLRDLTGCLGQKRPGPHTRSVSAADLELYSKCAARWYLEWVCLLPREYSSSDAAERGTLIHTWLAQAHARGTRCTEADLTPYDDEGTFTGTLTESQYAKAHDFLVAHARSCALDSEWETISIESPVYGYDAAADVVIASQPDMVCRDSSGRIIVHETKTTTEMPADKKDAFDRFFAVPWLINMAGTDKDVFGESHVLPRVELEVITPKDSRKFVWDLEHDDDTVRMAHADVRRRAGAWNRDITWSSAPGPQCTWCPVRRWCPDAADPDRAGGEQLRLSDEPCAGLPQGSPD